MSIRKQLTWAALAAVLVGSNVATYLVDAHLDYVNELESKVAGYEEKNADLEGENLGLKSVLSERPEPGLERGQ